MNSNEFLIAVKDDIKLEFERVDKRFFNFSIPFLINPVGKGVRTLYCYYLARAVNLDMTKAIKIASAAEIVHLASLIHDDCIDNAVSRRGNPTLNSMFGVSKAILIGDMIVYFAFERAKSLGEEVCFSLVDCVRLMSEGALFEENTKFSVINEKDYYDLVFRKTSSLFRWISLSVSYLSGRNDFSVFDGISKNFGLSFQIVDDVLDIEGQKEFTGKDSMKDLVEGRMTYPAIIAFEKNDFKTMIEDYFQTRDIQKLVAIRRYLTENGFTRLARNKALSLIEEIKDDVIKIGVDEKVFDFYNYVYSVAGRNI